MGVIEIKHNKFKFIKKKAILNIYFILRELILKRRLVIYIYTFI